MGVEGSSRAKILSQVDCEDNFLVNVELCVSSNLGSKDADALSRAVIDQFENYVKLNKKIPPEVLSSLDSIEDIDCLADTIAAHMPLKLSQKQDVLELIDIQQRLEFLMSMMESEIDLLQVEKRIRTRVKRQMEYYLNEQIKAIQKELGGLNDDLNEFDSLSAKINDAGMPEEIKKKTISELNKLKLMSTMSAESNVVRGYIDWILSVPWRKKTKVKKI